MPPEDRYRHDPVFRNLVDMIYAGIVDHQFTPTEVRDAAMLAALKYELRYGLALNIPPRSGVQANHERDDHLRHLTETATQSGGPK